MKLSLILQLFESKFKSLPAEGESYDPPQMVVTPSPPKKSGQPAGQQPPSRVVPSRSARATAAAMMVKDYDSDVSDPGLPLPPPPPRASSGGGASAAATNAAAAAAAAAAATVKPSPVGSAEGDERFQDWNRRLLQVKRLSVGRNN